MNLFVANVNYRIDSDKLKSLFEVFGTVESARVIFDKETRRSKGFGFVDMPNDEEAMTAIREMTGKEVEGKELVVKESEPRR